MGGINMKIKITTDGYYVTLSDENLDNDNYVNIKITGNNSEMEQDISINDLMPALIAFDAKRSRRLSDERE
jgi:hypothetical protein